MWLWLLFGLPVLRFLGLLPVAGLTSVDPLLEAIPPIIGLPGIVPPDSGLGGRLVVRTPLGGCGNAFMLMVFLIVLPAAFTPGVPLCFGNGVLGPDVADVGVLKFEEGARRPLLGRVGVDTSVFVSEIVLIPPMLFLDFVGKAGNAVVGGPYEGRGIVAAIVITLCVVVSVDVKSEMKRRTNVLSGFNVYRNVGT